MSSWGKAGDGHCRNREEAIVVGKSWQWGWLLSALPWKRLGLRGRSRRERLGMGVGTVVVNTDSHCHQKLVDTGAEVAG